MNTFTLGLIVIGYLLSLAYLGFLGYKKTTNTSDYLVGGRQMNPIVMALSYGATFISASALADSHRADRIPVVGVVTAGLPILAVENIEGYLPWDGEAGCFALRVRGDSMIGAGILDGDRVVVRAQPTADNGEIVVALLGDSATVKRFRKDGKQIWLLPENPAYDPIDGNQAQIIGKVKAVIRTY